MKSLARVLAGRAALAAALLSFACQKDGDALFDNSGLDQPSAGSGGSVSTGAQASGGSVALGGSSSPSEAGEGGADAPPGGGSAGAASEGGTGGGSAGGGGKGEEGGSAGSGGNAGSAGSGGTKPDPEPEPVTLELSEFEDSYVSSCATYTNFGDSNEIRVDAEAPGDCVYRALFSVALDSIPEGAVVSNATLTFTCIDAGGLIDAAYATEAWSQNDVRWNNRPDSSEATVGSMTCAAPEATVTLDLKVAVVAWLSGEQANHGIVLSTEAENGTDLVSSEGPSESRPVLSVTYTLPVK